MRAAKIVIEVLIGQKRDVIDPARSLRWTLTNADLEGEDQGARAYNQRMGQALAYFLRSADPERVEVYASLFPGEPDPTYTNAWNVIGHEKHEPPMTAQMCVLGQGVMYFFQYANPAQWNWARLDAIGARSWASLRWTYL